MTHQSMYSASGLDVDNMVPQGSGKAQLCSKFQSKKEDKMKTGKSGLQGVRMGVLIRAGWLPGTTASVHCHVFCVTV